MISENYNTPPPYVNPRLIGAALRGRSGGGGSAQRACSLPCPYLGNSPESIPPPRSSSPLSSLRSVLTLGTAESSNGEIVKIDIFRHAARIHRNNRTATTQTTKPLPEYDADQRANIARFFINHNLPLPEYETILKAIAGGAAPTRGEIDHFSRKSKARLKHIAGNCSPELISQFCLTYPLDIAPKDGRTTKRHLDNFLRWLRRQYPGVAYLWVLEFQNSGSPHYHLFLPFPRDLRKSPAMARAWARIIGARHGNLRKCITVHAHPKNFTRWEMRKGGYLTKYLDKDRQKRVPRNFTDVGRFWGASRNLLCPSESVTDPDHWETIEHHDRTTGEVITTNPWKDFYRILRKHHEATLRRIGKKRKSRITNQFKATVNLPSGGAVLRHYLLWYDREKARETTEPPF